MLALTSLTVLGVATLEVLLLLVDIEPGVGIVVLAGESMGGLGNAVDIVLVGPFGKGVFTVEEDTPFSVNILPDVVGAFPPDSCFFVIKKTDNKIKL